MSLAVWPTLLVTVQRTPATLLPLASNSEGSETFLALVAGFGFGLFLVYDGFNKWRRKRLIEDTPTARVRSMAVGRTELEGVAHSDSETIEAPFTDEECLHVDWEVEEWRRDHDDEYHWVTIATGSRSVPFYLDDGTGRVLVRTDEGRPDYEISGSNSKQFAVGSGSAPPAEVTEFIQRHDGQSDDVNFFADPIDALTDLIRADRIGHSGRRRRYSQSVLPDGSTVYVLGSAVPRESEASAEGGQETLLEITRTEDLDTFLVSDRGETGLENYYEKRGPLEIVGGLALSAVCLGLLVALYLPGV